jgi:hypothetical protein
MLFSVDGERISEIPAKRRAFFNSVIHDLGPARTEEVRRELNRLVDELRPQDQTGRRTVNASYLGSELTPWPYPLAHLYYFAEASAAENTPEEEIQKQAGFSFGLFLWDCMIRRGDSWTVYDPNLRDDPNREVIGKTYYERSVAD